MHVLGDVEVEDSGKKPSQIKVISDKQIWAGADPAVQGNYRSAVYLAIEAGPFETLEVTPVHMNQKGIQIGGGSRSTLIINDGREGWFD